MRAIDTNVAARLLLDDDPVQSKLARDIVAAGVLVPATVILELSWLLESRYRMTRGEAHELISAFLGLETVSIHDREQVEWAVRRYGKGADLADMLHVAMSAGASSFATFDKDIGKQVGKSPPIPIEVLKA